MEVKRGSEFWLPNAIAIECEAPDDVGGCWVAVEALADSAISDQVLVSQGLDGHPTAAHVVGGNYRVTLSDNIDGGFGNTQPLTRTLQVA